MPAKMHSLAPREMPGTYRYVLIFEWTNEWLNCIIQMQRNEFFYLAVFVYVNHVAP